jgi:hypothetical protein
VLVFRAAEQDQLHAVVAFNVSIMARRDLEEVTCTNMRLDPRIDHADHKLTTNAVASVAHRA